MSNKIADEITTSDTTKNDGLHSNETAVKLPFPLTSASKATKTLPKFPKIIIIYFIFIIFEVFSSKFLEKKQTN